MVWLGEMSFGIYLLHRPIQWGFAVILKGTALAQYGNELTLGLTLIAAAFASALIERPARNLVRAWGERVLASKQAEAT